MPPISIQRVAAPSPTLLKFLRHQTDPFGSISFCRPALPLRQARARSTQCNKDDIKLISPPRYYHHPSGRDHEVAGSRYPSGLISSTSIPHPRRHPSSDANPSLRRLFSSSTIKQLWDFLALKSRKQTLAAGIRG